MIEKALQVDSVETSTTTVNDLKEEEFGEEKTIF